MLHIALATIVDVDVVVIWNFNHIVRLDKIRLFNAVNIESGYKPLVIYGPMEVTNLAAKQTIRAVEMVQRTHDDLARQLANKSVDEIVAFYRVAGTATKNLHRLTPRPAVRARRLTRG